MTPLTQPFTGYWDEDESEIPPDLVEYMRQFSKQPHHFAVGGMVTLAPGVYSSVVKGQPVRVTEVNSYGKYLYVSIPGWHDPKEKDRVIVRRSECTPVGLCYKDVDWRGAWPNYFGE